MDRRNSAVIDLWNVRTLVVDVHHEDERNLTAYQVPLVVFLPSSEDFPVRKTEKIP